MLQPEHIDPKLLYKETELNTSLIVPEGMSVHLKYIEWTNPSKDTVWLFITAVCDKKAVGFADIRYYPQGEIKIAKLEAPQRIVARRIGAPYQEIRDESIAANDGLFVLPERRGQKIGSELFSNVLALLKEKGADQLTVIYPKKASNAFYKSFGGEQYLGELSNFHFKLK